MISSFRDWTELPPELLDFIAKKMDRFLDYVRFSGVCPQWRKVFFNSDNGHNKRLCLLKLSRRKLPMLMIKTEEHNNDERNLYSVSDGMTYTVKLPSRCKDRVFGSFRGWLMYFEENQAITLMNPLNASCISLPKFEGNCYAHWRHKNPSYYVVKGTLSADPLVSPDNYTVAVIYNMGKCKLAIYKSGDKHWRFVEFSLYNHFFFIDITFHKGNLYGVDLNSRLAQIDIDSLIVRTIIHAGMYADVNYLIESQEDLLLVQRFWSYLEENASINGETVDLSSYSCRAETIDFKVSKLVVGEDSAKWVQIFDIGEQAFFVGGNDSVSVSTVEFPGCLSNSIYYTSQLYLVFLPYKCCGPDEDAGIFRLEDKSVHSHHILDTFEWYEEPPIWFVPS